MKIKVTFKSPDAIYEALRNIKDEDKREAARAAIRKWVTYGEYITIEFDIMTGEAKVIKSK